MIEKALVSWIRRIKKMSLSYFSKNNVNLPGLKISDCIFHSKVKLNLGFLIPLFKCLYWIILSIPLGHPISQF